jgi:hypothetical protein
MPHGNISSVEAALLISGLFTPIVRVPIIGTIIFFSGTAVTEVEVAADE